MTTTQAKVARASSVTLRLLSYFFLRWVSSQRSEYVLLEFDMLMHGLLSGIDSCKLDGLSDTTTSLVIF